MFAEKIQRPATAIRATALEPTIGAQIEGVDLRHPLDAQTRDQVRALLLRHKVLFFRDQHIDTAQQLAFARQFGPTLT